jgi:hypothetical protein
MWMSCLSTDVDQRRSEVDLCEVRQSYRYLVRVIDADSSSSIYCMYIALKLPATHGANWWAGLCSRQLTDIESVAPGMNQ